MSTQSITAVCKPQLKQPAKYKVMFFNDDISTFQCVMDILVNYFNKSEDSAYELAFKIHIQDCAVVGTYTKDIAETKTSLAKADIKTSGYPLKIELFESL